MRCQVVDGESTRADTTRNGGTTPCTDGGKVCSSTADARQHTGVCRCGKSAGCGESSDSENGDRQKDSEQSTTRHTTSRYDILDAAYDAVTQRLEHYGKPEDNFAIIAEYWSTFTGIDLEAWQVAVMLVLLKIARTHTDHTHIDSWVDMAGYAACGGEVAAR